MDLATRADQVVENGAGAVVASGGTMMQTRSTYATAVSVQKPRVLKEVARRLEEEAMLAEENFYYSWRAGSDQIEGPSVDLALAAARYWGNCAIEQLPVQETHDSYIFTSAFIDLETGFTLARQFRQSKSSVVHGKLDPERKADVRFQIGQSKAIRNVVLNALPDALINKAMAVAKQGVRDKIEKFVKDKGIAAAQDYVLKQLGKYGIKEERVLAKFGVAEVKAIDIEMIVSMRGDIAALDAGKERAEDLYPAPEGAGAAKLNDALSSAAAPAPAPKEEKPKPAAKKAAAKKEEPKPEPKAEAPAEEVEAQPVEVPSEDEMRTRAAAWTKEQRQAFGAFYTRSVNEGVPAEEARRDAWLELGLKFEAEANAGGAE